MMIQILFLLFTSSYITAQETPSQLCNRFTTKYQNCTDASLLSFARMAGEHPVALLEMVPTFYATQSKKPENCNWWSCMRAPLSTLKKAIVYAQLSRAINQQIYGQRASHIIEKMNEKFPEFIESTDIAEVHASYLEKLALLTDDQQCIEQSSAQFAREWPFHAIPVDLEAYKNRLESLHQEFENEKQQLTLSEQNDGTLEKFKVKLESNIISLERAIDVITHRKMLEIIDADPVAFIVQQIQNNCLREALETYRFRFPLNKMNNRIKEQHQLGNGIFHEICLTPYLSPDQKIMALTILDEQSFVCINDHNANGKTPLDLLDQDTPFKKVLASLGAQHSLPRVTQIGKSNSFSGRPSTPDMVKAESKKQLRFSSDTKTQS